MALKRLGVFIAVFVFLLVFYANKALLKDAYSRLVMIPYAQSGHSREPLFVLSNEEMEDLTTQTLSETFVVSREDNSQRKKAWQSKVVGCKEENSGEQIASLAPSSLEEPVQQVLVPPKLKKSWNWKSMLLFGNAEEETVALMDEPAQEDLLQVEPQKKKAGVGNRFCFLARVFKKKRRRLAEK